MGESAIKRLHKPGLCQLCSGDTGDWARHSYRRGVPRKRNDPTHLPQTPARTGGTLQLCQQGLITAMIFRRMNSTHFRVGWTLRRICTRAGNYDSQLTARLQSVTQLPIVHSQGYVCGLPVNHRFQMRKFRKLFDILCRLAPFLVNFPQRLSFHNIRN